MYELDQNNQLLLERIVKFYEEAHSHYGDGILCLDPNVIYYILHENHCFGRKYLTEKDLKVILDWMKMEPSYHSYPYFSYYVSRFSLLKSMMDRIYSTRKYGGIPIMFGSNSKLREFNAECYTIAYSPTEKKYELCE